MIEIIAAILIQISTLSLPQTTDPSVQGDAPTTTTTTPTTTNGNPGGTGTWDDNG